jgi:hypothetical protein
VYVRCLNNNEKVYLAQLRLNRRKGVFYIFIQRDFRLGFYVFRGAAAAVNSEITVSKLRNRFRIFGEISLSRNSSHIIDNLDLAGFCGLRKCFVITLKTNYSVPRRMYSQR